MWMVRLEYMHLVRQWSIVTQRQRIDVGRQPTVSRASESVSVRTNVGASMSVKGIVRTCTSIRVRAGAKTSASVTESASIIGSNSVRTSVSACIGVKGILHQKIFYRLNLIFWIVMGCGIVRFGRRGLKTTET